MARKYDLDLLEKLKQREVEIDYKGAKVIIKRLPDSDEKGAMDARLYRDMKGQMKLMQLMPKGMMKMDATPKSVAKLRKMFNGVKSIPVVERSIKITRTTVKAEDGYEIPVRIYKSDMTSTNSPVLYYIHGGGFFGGNPDVVEESVKLFVDKTNLCAVSVDYRLAPENPFPTGHKDCYNVLKWIYENGKELDIDSNNIFVGGDSAGGNLTQYCTTRSGEDGVAMVKGQLLLYATLNMAGTEDEYFSWNIDQYEMLPKQRAGLEMMIHMFQGMGGGMGDMLGTTEIDNDYLNPYTRNPKDNPPTFITVGEHDFLKVESLAYAAKLTAAGVETKTIVYNGLGHAYFDNCGVYPQCEDCIIEMGNFIRSHCNGTSVLYR